MLSNSLKQMLEGKLISPELAQKRPEQLSVAEFVDLTNQIAK
jgi:16S rRNA A1518/A1519 N6-dimethyltransferase RsmA/KsgA/DIM1 with predicted DNA glycosylase/AP lyase activity